LLISTLQQQVSTKDVRTNIIFTISWLILLHNHSRATYLSHVTQCKVWLCN